MTNQSIRFCALCGGKTQLAHPPDGDVRKRDICTVCGHVHYVNPINVVGTIPVWQGQVLLCKRNIEPRKGMWTLPAGFMELGESLSQGAVRESQEEAGISGEIVCLFSVVDVVRVNQVHFYYVFDMETADVEPGFETMETRFCTRETVPWEQLAFPSVSETLKLYFDDVEKKQLGSNVHQFSIKYSRAT